MSETLPLHPTADGLFFSGDILEIVTRNIGAGLVLISRDISDATAGETEKAALQLSGSL
ncbi:MAG: hypothetical protein OEV89_09205 [Desulfobulbaceae bacterium]|nr:hypothetical protein [Desulfobulbaceae bacterium]HIJ90868.1 hypothetical protein [Deltaproteobacteria bacterium]